MREIFSQKMIALKKAFTWKKVAVAIAIIAIVVMIAVPIHIKKSRSEAAILLLQRIALAEMAMQTECMGPPGEYVFTDGIDETEEIAVEKMAIFGFRPDPSVAFHIMRPPAVGDVPTRGFIAFTAHNSVGSRVYVYDNVNGRAIEEVRGNGVYGGIIVADSAFDLYCYTYDSSKKINQVRKSSAPIQFAPKQNGKTTGRMVVTATAGD